MTEENTTANTTLEGSAFARILGQLMETRGIPADEEHALELAEKSGLERDAFLARLAGDMNAYPGDLSKLAGALALSAYEKQVLALSYALEEEREVEEPGLITRPENVILGYEELPEGQRMRPLRCQVGRRDDDQCPRDATTRPDFGPSEYPAMCDEHARDYDLSLDASEWGVSEEMTGEWLRLAREWGFEPLERLAENIHEDAKAGFLKAEARADLAREIADAPRKNRRERMADLTPEQDEKITRLISRSDALINARTALEEYATGKMDEKVLRSTLGVLIEESEKATEEAHRYSEEVGIKPE